MKKNPLLKWYSNHHKLVLLTFLTLFLLTQQSCRKDSSTVSNQSFSLKESILKMGYDTTGIIDLENSFLVEGDILLEKSIISKTTPRQAINSTSQLVSSSKVQNMTIRIDNSMPIDGSNFDWRYEIAQAADEYNNLFGSNAHFTLTTSSTADITIVVNNSLPYNVIAAAGLPSGGNPYSQIIVNSGYAYTPISSGQKKYNIMHELGHCIGLRHTNWYIMGETSAIGIGLSPNSGFVPDWSSIFNGGTAGNSWIGWSYWDVYAIGYLYPAPPSINGSLLNYTTTGAIYWGYEGNYRWIYNYETLTSLFGDRPWDYWTNTNIAPSPIGTTLGALPTGQRYAFLANDLNTGKVYFVERKRLYEGDVNSPLYNYCRHIYTMNVFNNYKFNSSKIENYNITFSTSPASEAWIEGPILYK